MPRHRNDEGPTRSENQPAKRPPETESDRDRVPPRRRGGQELPDAVQDRPEQNAGYDAAVRGESTATPQETAEDLEIGLRPERSGVSVDPFEDDAERRPRTADDRAERDAAADVRFQDRKSR